AKLVGVRHQVHDEADPEWLGKKDVRRGIGEIGKAGLAYDILVKTRELPAALALVRGLADMRFVIDHIAKPPIASGVSSEWAASGSSAETPRSCTGSRCRPLSRGSRFLCHRSPRNGGHEMQAYGMALDLRDDPQLIARYKKEHAEVWPEVVARLRDIGVTEMKIFLLGRRMFMYCETRDGFDPANDFARSNDDPTYKKWDELMRTMQQRVDEARPGEW